jgi:phospholipase/carboxylesterase
MPNPESQSDREGARDAAEGQLGARPQPGPKPDKVLRGTRPLGLGERRDGLLHVPRSYDASRPAPLLVVLHGAGASGGDVLPWVVPLADARGFLILAPDSRASSWDVIRGGYGPDVRSVDRALRQVFERHAVDAKRIGVGGFSDGASYALSLGLINGLLFSDILAFSPGFMAPTLVEDAPRIFVSHGVHDTVLPIDRCSRALVPRLRAQGLAVDYREFSGGHVVPPEMVAASLEFLGDGGTGS